MCVFVHAGRFAVYVCVCVRVCVCVCVRACVCTCVCVCVTCRFGELGDYLLVTPQEGQRVEKAIGMVPVRISITLTLRELRPLVGLGIQMVRGRTIVRDSHAELGTLSIRTAPTDAATSIQPYVIQSNDVSSMSHILQPSSGSKGLYYRQDRDSRFVRRDCASVLLWRGAPRYHTPRSCRLSKTCAHMCCLIQPTHVAACNTREDRGA